MRAGLTLLETLVALVIFGLVGVAFLGVFSGALRTSDAVADWTRALAAAEQAMEATKAGLDPADVAPIDLRPVVRRVPEEPGVERAEVVVAVPGGGSFVLERLVSAP